MKNLSCANCGGIMTLDASAMTAVCRFCGSRYVLSREDTDYFLDFYRQMNSFLHSSGDEKDRKTRADELWETADEVRFTTSDGKDITVRYLSNYSEQDADVYVARRNIIFVFDKDGAAAADKYRTMISALDYPSADTRSLADFFPRVAGGYQLDDGRFILVVNKDEDEYPLRLFGKLTGRHVAWIISRLENLCCVLEFSGLVHPSIDPDTVYINPYTHQASLYGSWWLVTYKNTMNDDMRILRSVDNLKCIRSTASQILGDVDAPEALTEFINSEPKVDAYNDFAYWDEMLIKAYGERKFINMEIDDGKIYGREKD